MSINLKRGEIFPNWPLAMEFLRRSPLNFVLCNTLPPDDMEEHLKWQVLLHGVPSAGNYFNIPRGVDEAHIEALCASIARQRAPGDHLGSIRGTNFVAFLKEFTVILGGKFEFTEVAQAITDKTCELFDADGASILIPNEDLSHFRFAFFKTSNEEVRRKLASIQVPGDKGVTGWVARHRRSILVDETNRDLVFNPNISPSEQFLMREIIATDISLDEKLIGILQVVNRRDGKFRKSDLQIIELIATIIAFFMEKARLYDERLAYAKVERELAIAHELQTSFMPTLPTAIGPFRLSGESRPTSRVGGDFWDVIRLNADESVVILGDVSGHGLGAALIMSAVRTASRAIMPHIDHPRDLIEPLNALIHADFGINTHYVTMIVCYLDHTTRQITYFRAGHEYPLLKTGQGIIQMKEKGGWPIGLFPVRMDDEWIDFHFQPDECLMLYTDGVLDGLPDETARLDQILTEQPELIAAVDEGTFFRRLAQCLMWVDNDDATILKLTLSE